MEDREFFDLLYQRWSKTTGAEACFWMPEKCSLFNEWRVYAVDQNQEKTWLGTFMNEADADFITAVHGCVGDLIRRLHEALDEADRADADRDDREKDIYDLAVETAELRDELNRLKAAAKLAPEDERTGYL